MLRVGSGTRALRARPPMVRHDKQVGDVDNAIVIAIWTPRARTRSPMVYHLQEVTVVDNVIVNDVARARQETRTIPVVENDKHFGHVDLAVLIDVNRAVLAIWTRTPVVEDEQKVSGVHDPIFVEITTSGRRKNDPWIRTAKP